MPGVQTLLRADHRRQAIVATAHRMIRVMGAMMRMGKAYDADYKG